MTESSVMAAERQTGKSKIRADYRCRSERVCYLVFLGVHKQNMFANFF